VTLRELSVRDLALIERVRLTLEPGFTVITGETGAGKSLLIDALSLVMGGRADAGLIRHGAPGARVEALFDRLPEPLICVRELGAGGRSVARLDDETVTAGRLAAVVGPLVEIHGQHDQQRLLQASWQRDVLDAHAGHDDQRSEVRDMVRAWRANEAALAELITDRSELERRIELAEHAAAEIEAADPQPGEAESLRARLALVASSEKMRLLLTEADALLAADGDGARDRLGAAVRAAAELAALDGSMTEVSQRLAGLEAEMDDLVLELRRRQEALAEEGRDVSAIEERLGLLYGLLRKYGPDEEAVARYGHEARAEADRLRNQEQERARREADAVRLEAAAREAAAVLSDMRRQAAERLGRAVTQALVELGFPDASFDVSISEAPLDECGADQVGYLLAPNPGEPARPLARIASGGELSRVALAIKGVLARADVTPTLVFDEVDAGIGGRSADPVGRSLWMLAREHQVICVTHLPQIAAYADAHLRIEKVARDGRTITEVRRLAADERRTELAQMLGGSAGEEGALAAAGELLERAARLRRTAGAAA
jgi:DNA repair protein RecN (Recombination protein N)